MAKTFDGITFDEPRDGNRLRAQFNRVWAVMADQEWHIPAELKRSTGDEWASISARLRDFRKPKFGGHEVKREFVSKGLWRYRLVVSRPESAPAQSWQMTVQGSLL